MKTVAGPQQAEKGQHKSPGQEGISKFKELKRKFGEGERTHRRSQQARGSRVHCTDHAKIEHVFIQGEQRSIKRSVLCYFSCCSGQGLHEATLRRIDHGSQFEGCWHSSSWKGRYIMVGSFMVAGMSSWASSLLVLAIRKQRADRDWGQTLKPQCLTSKTHFLQWRPDSSSEGPFPLVKIPQPSKQHHQLRTICSHTRIRAQHKPSPERWCGFWELLLRTSWLYFSDLPSS